MAEKIIRKNFSLTPQHLEMLSHLARRGSIKESDKMRRLIEDEWERLSMDEWVRKNPRPVKE